MATLTSIFDRKIINLQPGNYYKLVVNKTGTIANGITSLTTVDISDFQINSPSANQVLQFNGTKWVNTTISTGGGGGTATTALSALTSDVTISSPVSGQVLQYNGSRWINATISTGGGGTATTALSALTSDVTITSPANGHLLRYNGSRWVNAFIDLSTLTNVLISSPINGQVLKYDGSKWVNGTDNVGSGSGSSTISGMSDVLITGLSTNQVLQYNGTKWVNTTLSTGGGGGTVSGVTPFEIICTDWAAGQFTLPSGWTATKVNSDTALQVTHNKAKTPLLWGGINTASSPNLSIVPTATRNMQIDSTNQVTFLQVGTMTSFKLEVLFV